MNTQTNTNTNEGLAEATIGDRAFFTEIELAEDSNASEQFGIFLTTNMRLTTLNHCRLLELLR